MCAATFNWSESNGAGEVVTDGISNINFGSNDSANIVPATHPIVAGDNSYQKYIRGKFTGVTGDITNMKLWKSAGALKTGEAIIGKNNVAYAVPSTTPDGGDAAIPTTEGTAWSVQSTEGDPSKITVDGYTKYQRLQTTTTGSTPSGAVNTKTVTFQYDEA